MVPAGTFGGVAGSEIGGVTHHEVDPLSARQSASRLDRSGDEVDAGHPPATLGEQEVRTDLSRDAVVSVLVLAMDVRNYDWLVRRRGFNAADFRRWYVGSVGGAILGTRP